MTEEDAFLLDLLARPDDEAARLIYADWLADHDDPRADLVRQAYQMRSVKASDPAHFEHVAAWRRAQIEHGWQDYDGLLLTWDQMVTVFRFRLAEVIAHCGPEMASLRTWEMEPRTLVGYSDPGWQPWRHRDEWLQMLLELSVVRRQQLERLGRAPTRLATHLGGGRLILSVPQWSLPDQAVSRNSNGFFDQNNLPPWDTWVARIDESITASPEEGYLLSWVPPGWLYWASLGVAANIEGGPVWAHETTTPFLRRLRQAGIAGC
jgi:uncharacterized protein (TIGR02996 family)